MRRVDPLRLDEVLEEGDARRRASTGLVVDALRAERAEGGARARGYLERALQVDPNNPYVYLALARHHAGGASPERALAFLDRAEGLLEDEGALSPGVEVHLVGLRGAALMATGDVRAGLALLERAKQSAPEVWGDGRLSPEELQ